MWQVFGAYGIPASARHIKVVKKGKKKTETVAKYEIDHLVSRELGGADDVKNLFRKTPGVLVRPPQNEYAQKSRNCPFPVV